MFEQLTGRLQTTLRKLRGSAKVDEASFGEVARELRLALLEADVHFGVVKDFLAAVKEKALGEEVARSLTPGQQVIKIVNEELVAVLGGERQDLRFSGPAPHVVLIVGLQGAGKTTTVGKLGNMLRGQGRSPMLVSVDVHRPAAREQLATLGESTGLPVWASDSDDPVVRARDAVQEARRRGDDVVLVDTAGRLHIDRDDGRGPAGGGRGEPGDRSLRMRFNGRSGCGSGRLRFRGSPSRGWAHSHQARR